MQVLSAGNAAPQSLRSLCMDLKDSSQMNDTSLGDIYAYFASGARSGASTSGAFAASVESVLSNTAASLESLALFIPYLRTSLPAMAALQHLTLHQDSFCTFSSLHVSGLPRLRSLALLQAPSVECEHAPALHLDLGCLHELQAVYLVNQLPEALTLPSGCALHMSGSCCRILRLRHEPEWEHALMQVQSIREDYTQGISQQVAQFTPVPFIVALPQSTLSGLTALTIVCSKDVKIGSEEEPRSLGMLPALERLVLVSGTTSGSVHFYFPASMHLKRMWAGRRVNFTFKYDSAASFTSGMEDVGLMGILISSPGMSSFIDALQERGTPLVKRPPRPQGENSVHVIEGCRYDTEAGQKHTCACQTCLDCLIRRSCRPSELPLALDEAPF